MINGTTLSISPYVFEVGHEDWSQSKYEDPGSRAQMVRQVKRPGATRVGFGIAEWIYLGAGVCIVDILSGDNVRIGIKV